MTAAEPVVRFEMVALWCAACDRFVELQGPVYGARKDSPVHVTPAAWAPHRAAAHGVVVAA